jgi:hypothetical protein
MFYKCSIDILVSCHILMDTHWDGMETERNVMDLAWIWLGLRANEMSLVFCEHLARWNR